MGDHHRNDGSKTKGQSLDTVSTGVVDWDTDSEGEKPSLCCLQGCISATVVGVSFFLGLPTGILLVVLALNSGDDTTLMAVGIVLIILPIVILIIVLLLCFNQKRLPSLVFWKKKMAPHPKTPQPTQTNNTTNSASAKTTRPTPNSNHHSTSVTVPRSSSWNSDHNNSSWNSQQCTNSNGSQTHRSNHETNGKNHCDNNDMSQKGATLSNQDHDNNNILSTIGTGNRSYAQAEELKNYAKPSINSQVSVL